VVSDSALVIVKVDETIVIKNGSVDAQITADPIDQIRFYSVSDTSDGYTIYDDIIFIKIDGAGRTDFIGDTRIDTLLTNGDGSTLEWTRSGGTTDYEMVDDPLYADNDGDTTYIYAALASGFKSLFVKSLLLDSYREIKGVSATFEGRADTGAVYTRSLIKSGSTEAQGDSHLNSVSVYQLRRHQWDVDPDTNGDWTHQTINALEIGVKVD
jgi:hypothetical protein